MITKIRHFGIVVQDLGKSIRFYEDLGFSLWKREMESGSFTDQVVDLPQVEIETAKLKSSCGAMIELLQYHSHPIQKERAPQPSNHLGCSHIAFTVESIENMLHTIQISGGNLVNKPALAPTGQVKVAYCHDPEGNLLEVVEEI
jgi:catechol 2,3-dioxygenase-like lactoylglutathione lyase family enzyme